MISDRTGERQVTCRGGYEEIIDSYPVMSLFPLCYRVLGGSEKQTGNMVEVEDNEGKDR